MGYLKYWRDWLIKIGWVLSIIYIAAGTAWSIMDPMNFRQLEVLYLIGLIPWVVFILWRTGNLGKKD